MTPTDLIRQIDAETLRHRDLELRRRAAERAVKEWLEGRGTLKAFAVELAKAERERLVRK